MSAFPRDPDHFYRWVRQHHDPQAQPQDFVPRRVYGDYVEGLLARLPSTPPTPASYAARPAWSVSTGAATAWWCASTTGTRSWRARSCSRPVPRPAPTGRPRSSSHPVGSLDPWTDALPDGDLLLVGTGLTMVDVAIAADRPGRTLHTVSRHDVVPAHARAADDSACPAAPRHHPPAHPRRAARRGPGARRAHRRRDRRLARRHRRPASGDRPAVARPLRRRPPDLPGRRRPCLGRPPPPHAAGHRPAPGRRRRGRPLGPAHRHRERCGPATDDGVRRHPQRRHRAERGGGRQLHRPGRRAGQRPAAARPRPRPAWCAPDPPGSASTPPTTAASLGVLPPTIPFYAIGTLRRGNLWETTAMPEIREQAYDVAGSVVRAAARRDPPPADRPLRPDADHQPQGGRGLQPGAGPAAPPPGRRRGRASRPPSPPTRASPRRTPRWPCSATSGARSGSWRQALQAAHAAAADRNLDDREVSFLDAVTTRLRSDEETGAAALLRHIRLFPRDALAVSVAVPTVAFGGLTSGRQTAAARRGTGPHLRRRLVVRRPAGVRAPGPGALGRGGGAGVVRPVGRARLRTRRARPHPRLLRDRRAHRRARLARRLDPEPRARGQPPLPLLLARRAARADAVRRRRRPPSLRARAGPAAGDRLAGAGRQRRRCCGAATSPAPGRAHCRARPSAHPHPTGGCSTRRRPFAAMHSALGLAAEGDDVGLAALRTIAHAHHDPAFRDVVAPLCGALQQVVEGQPTPTRPSASPPCSPAPACWAAAWRSARCSRTRWSTRSHSRDRASGPQRSSIPRLSRRQSPLDARRRAALTPAAVDGSGGTTT